MKAISSFKDALPVIRNVDPQVVGAVQRELRLLFKVIPSIPRDLRVSPHIEMPFGSARTL